MAYTPTYVQESPFGVTDIIGRFMTYYIHRRIPPNALDVVVPLDARYDKRPDLLAADIYGDPDLFWVVPLRNGLQDPVFDLKRGEEFTIPHPSFEEVAT